MIRQARATLTALLGSIVAVTLVACASQQARDTEQLLAAAGFQVRYANTPQKLANVETLTQRKLIAHPFDGGVRYVYADAAGCKCVYAGDERAYQQYQRMAVQEKISDQNMMAAEMNQNAAMDWGLWQPWYPYGW